MRLIALVFAMLAVARVAGGIFYIPTTSIDNTQAYYEELSQNWASVRNGLEEQIESYGKNKNYGVYVIMTSIYGETLPTSYDESYVHSLLNKFQDLGPRTWSDMELQSISSTYQIGHQTAYVISAATHTSSSCSWMLAAAAVSGTALALLI